MPFAKIHVLEGRYGEARLDSVSNAIQQTLRAELGMAPDELFHIIHVLPPAQFWHTRSFLGLNYSDDLIWLEVTLITEGESGTASGEQLTLVPGIVGSCASGGEAKVVAGAPGTVAAEKRLVNGLGPPKGDDTIAPGVVGIPNAVVPMVDICAIQQPLLLSKVTITAHKTRMSNCSAVNRCRPS